MKVLVVRAAEDARRTAARLQSLGREAIVSPVLEIRRTNQALPEMDFDAVIATSAHAFQLPASDALARLPVFVVGNRTAEAAHGAGFRSPAFVASDAPDLAQYLASRLRPGTRLLYLAGRDRKPALERVLAAGNELCVVETYAADAASALREEARAALRAHDVGAALHYSRRSAAVFCDIVAQEKLGAAAAAVRHIAISADAAAPLLSAGCRVEIAGAPDEDSMFRILEGR